jgi:hypothetical protein
MPHDLPFGLCWSRKRGTVEIHDADTGEVVELDLSSCWSLETRKRTGLPEWVGQSLDRCKEAERDITPATRWEVSFFRAVDQPAPIHREVGWDQLVAMLTRWRDVPSREALPLWAAVTFREGGSRCNEDAVEASCLVLDYDHGPTIDEALRVWGRWACIVHTTSRHTSEAHRFRVVLPLARPVPASEWARVWRWAADHAGKADEQTKDVARQFFLYGGVDGVPRRAHVIDDRPLLWMDLDRLPRPPKVAPMPRPRLEPVTLPANAAYREFQERLKIDPDSRVRAGEYLGGRRVGEYMRQVACPQCSRLSVWWPIHPNGTPQAMCSHRNSCGWSGWLDELLARAGRAA